MIIIILYISSVPTLVKRWDTTDSRYVYIQLYRGDYYIWERTLGGKSVD